MKKIFALILGLSLLLTNAFAADSVLRNLGGQQILSKGGALEQTTSMQFDKQTILGLLPLLSGGEADQKTKTLFNSVLGALEKLEFHAVSNMQATDVTIKTKNGELAKIQARIDDKTGEGIIVTDLMPGVAFRFKTDPEMQKLVQSVSTKPEEFITMIAKNEKALGELMQKHLLKDAKAETGSFPLNDETFEEKKQAVVTSHALTDFALEAVEQLKKEEFFVSYIQSVLNMVSQRAALEKGADMKDMPKTADEALDKLTQNLKKVKDEENAELGELTVYTGKGNATAYIVTSDKSDQLVYMEQVEKKTENPMLGKVECLAIIQPKKQDAILYGAEGKTDSKDEAKPEEPALPTDWAMIKNKALGGESFGAVVLSLTADNKTEGERLHSDFKLTVTTSGTSFHIAANGSQSLGDTYDAKASMTIGGMAMDSLLTFNMTSGEAKNKPEAIDTKDLEIIDMAQTPDEETTKKLGNLLKEKTLPMLIERVKTALPDEAPLFLSLLPQK